MAQQIEAPSESDVERIARMIIRAQQLSQQHTGNELDGSLDDLGRIQVLLDSGIIQPEETMELQCIGIAFGKTFVENNAGFDWWMVEDEYGRDVCVRYRHTSLLIFPQTMLSKRIEDGEDVDVADLYASLQRDLAEIIAENFQEQ